MIMTHFETRKAGYWVRMSVVMIVIMDRFDALEDEVKTLKVKVNDLEAENAEMAGKIEKLEVI